ncbi:TetR/AcrR family transcriptional regulator [Desulfatitalea tepidiphila]|uniref:TetR/AcrR family transcriptional regulator n=1 Tax=Desulfatitalea tepidiphila TaxID=1185843 RepID=UPI0006B40AED|nr:TetR/AcrR family transcriptional regulator [Desulfatitalea tepidiphila]
MKHKGHTNPPGRQKIIEALTQLMRTRDFHSVTTAEIAQRAGVTEGLIYKYFSSKKDLLYQVLDDLFARFNEVILERITGTPSAIQQLDIIIASSIEYYAANRVFARILLLEVRNSQDYFTSEAYERVKTYARRIRDIIDQGIAKGEIKSDIDPQILRNVILGAIEHACLGEIIFSRKLDAQVVTQSISTILFNGAKA